jgi:hypothetical protein
MIQNIGWDDRKIAGVRRCKCQELNGLHGIKFGTDLWKEVEADLWESLGKTAAAQSKRAWKRVL